ncbi:MAG: CIA30 family protein [Myxococcota bacterium]
MSNTRANFPRTLLTPVVALAALSFTPSAEAGMSVVFDFRQQAEVDRWYAVNDDVMGGISQGNFSLVEPGEALFSGTLSLENNGGFSTVRSRARSWSELDGNAGLSIKVKGDGRTYSFFVQTSKQQDVLVYEVPFKTVAGEWITLDFGFELFRVNYMGWNPSGYQALEPRKIQKFGFMLNDGQQGPFALEVDWIATYW